MTKESLQVLLDIVNQVSISVKDPNSPIVAQRVFQAKKELEGELNESAK